MSRHTYTGTVEGQTYADYLDVETGSTLVAYPGQSYDIAQAGGHTVPGDDGEPIPLDRPVPPPDGNWTTPKDSPKRTNRPASVPADTVEGTG